LSRVCCDLYNLEDFLERSDLSAKRICDINIAGMITSGVIAIVPNGEISEADKKTQNKPGA
jgi:hypothetical protein